MNSRPVEPARGAEALALRAYAVVLSLLHGLTGTAWFSYKDVTTLVTGRDCVCWPAFPSCELARVYLSPALVRAAVVAYIALGVVSAVLFTLRRRRAAMASFLVATALGTAIYALDYRMRLNQTYMFGWVVVAFLVTPSRGRCAVLQTLVALFYFWAGTLKLNGEWVRGAALYERPYLVPARLVPAACVYVLVLEMALVWGLFSARPRWRWIVYAQLLLFHALSWKVVGYFYPLLMLGLTSIYPLVWTLSPSATLTFARLREDRSSLRTAALAAALFSCLQLVPHAFPGDTAITGEGRLFALHMFDARAECSGAARIHGSAGKISSVSLINVHLDARTRCDPIVLLAYARQVCRIADARSDIQSVDVTVDARRSSDETMRPLIHVDDFCRRGIDYSIVSHNSWIMTE